MLRKPTITLATMVLAGLPLLATVGCSDISDRNAHQTVSDDGTKGTRVREQTRTTSDGAVVREKETQERTVVQPAPNATPDVTKRDATKQ